MRQIEKAMILHVAKRSNFGLSNTSVVSFESKTFVYLHGNLIATVLHSFNQVQISSCGWQTVTTKSRLNALLLGLGADVQIVQKNFKWFLTNGEEFRDGIVIDF